MLSVQSTQQKVVSIQAFLFGNYVKEHTLSFSKVLSRMMTNYYSIKFWQFFIYSQISSNLICFHTMYRCILLILIYLKFKVLYWIVECCSVIVVKRVCHIRSSKYILTTIFTNYWKNITSHDLKLLSFSNPERKDHSKNPHGGLILYV